MRPLPCPLAYTTTSWNPHYPSDCLNYTPTPSLNDALGPDDVINTGLPCWDCQYADVLRNEIERVKDVKVPPNLTGIKAFRAKKTAERRVKETKERVDKWVQLIIERGEIGRRDVNRMEGLRIMAGRVNGEGLRETVVHERVVGRMEEQRRMVVEAAAAAAARAGMEREDEEAVVGAQDAYARRCATDDKGKGKKVVRFA
ncbi:hypothetical protein MRB53_037116 [Persea americana]|nr:hypothetical protein MRB53_037116 [Persea americana]